MANAPNKTQATESSVDDFLNAAPDNRRADSRTLAALMARATGQTPRLWGPSIVGFGVRRYRYESGREGETCAVGFSPRKAALTLYGLGASEHQALVQSLGKVTAGKGCVYIKALADIDLAVLERWVRNAFQCQAEVEDSSGV